MSSSRKRRPPSFDLTPPGDAEAASGWTYRTEADAKEAAPVAETRPSQTVPALKTAGRTEGVIDWVTWPVKFMLVLFFAPLHGTRRKPE